MHLNAFSRYGWVVGVGRYIGQTKGVMFTRNEGQVRFNKILSDDTLWLKWLQLNLHETAQLINYFDTWVIIWHGIVPLFLKICKDLQEICSISAQNCFCYCFWTILGTQIAKLFSNNTKNYFALICCKFLANLYKSSGILKQYDVKWWLNYRKYGSVSYSFSCKRLKTTSSRSNTNF